MGHWILFVCVVATVVGWSGVQKTSNYQNKWGSMMVLGFIASLLMAIWLWTVPLLIFLGLFFAWIVWRIKTQKPEE